jgi:hypothetical protein
MSEFKHSRRRNLPVEFLVYYDRSQLRAFAYVRRKDGLDLPDGEYDVNEGEDAGRRSGKKWNGKWQVEMS